MALETTNSYTYPLTRVGVVANSSVQSFTKTSFSPPLSSTFSRSQKGNCFGYTDSLLSCIIWWNPSFQAGYDSKAIFLHQCCLLWLYMFTNFQIWFPWAAFLRMPSLDRRLSVGLLCKAHCFHATHLYVPTGPRCLPILSHGHKSALWMGLPPNPLIE